METAKVIIDCFTYRIKVGVPFSDYPMVDFNPGVFPPPPKGTPRGLSLPWSSQTVKPGQGHDRLGAVPILSRDPSFQEIIKSPKETDPVFEKSDG